MPSPGEDVQAWSTTAANNSNADPLINWAEGQPRASVNNSARSMLAALAKNRNLQNGSITTGGTANAQTFTSGVTYTAPIPTGLFVRLKAGVTNTGATTLEMDGTGAVAIKDQFGSDITAGAMALGQYVELLYNGTNWILLRQSSAGTAPQCGRLNHVNATTLSFAPYNGNTLKINGIIYTIPSAGIAGLANTNIFKEGVAAQNLTASTRYYVYAFNNAGVVTADYSTTGHITSTTAGNEGVQIKSADNSRTLIGMIYANGVAQFQNVENLRLVISWFNRRNISFYSIPTNQVIGSTTPIELDINLRINFLNWGDEAIHAYLEGIANMNLQSALVNYGLRVDGTPTLFQSAFQSFANNSWGDTQQSAIFWPAEGIHTLTLYAWVSVGGAIATFNNAGISGMTRG